ncbi:exodeoxyribonuclease III [Amycolatopsis cihanbeyliensis]|uniref:Exodeoxyribonuclease III n=1 Tax=Amycolatopsis cihanbeyliensis TaxID=1128664 RepID=A0A542CSV2_AMYCI|nr:exodeoxyribonuclease III [Amycolatopsis cihanbeyliensis]TQI93903.1 exodeoxyribonuclease III [Amycolatopsis cihanbeyliensis]
MRIATWNVNSIGARLPRLRAWLESAAPDVLCVQELKCADDAFPREQLAELGYESASYGLGRWNGVAVLSRIGIEDVTRGLVDEPRYEEATEPRAIGATCGGVRVWSVYVPNGREPEHPHYQYKLRWLEALRATVAAETAATDKPFAVLGDFNIAPTDTDVWDISLFADSTHVTEAERKALAVLRDAGLTDVLPRPLKYDHPYTYWDYRALAFPKNRGMRIDLVYADATFGAAVGDAYVDREERKGKGSSDHAPVVVDLEL